MTNDFAVARTASGEGVEIVAVSGEIDISNAGDLKQEIWAALDAGALNVVLDLTEATFLGSTAIGVVIATAKRVRPLGGNIAIVNVAANIGKTFTITGIDEMFAVVPTRDEAIAAVSAPA